MGDQERHRFLTNIGGSFLLKVAGQGLMLLMMIMLARIMGASSYGIYIYVTTWLNVLILVGKLGTNTTLQRFVAVYFSQSRWAELNGLMRWSNYVVLMVCTVIILLGSLALLGGETANSELRRTFWLGWFVLPILALASLRQATLQGIKRVLHSQVPELIIRPLVVGLVVALIHYATPIQVTAPAAMSSYIVAVACSFIVGLYWQKKFLPAALASHGRVYRTKEWFRVSLPLLLTSGAYMALTHTDTIMIGWLVDATNSGIYNASSKIASLIQFGFISIQAATTPMIASLYAQGKHRQLQNILTFTALASTAFAIPFVVALAYFGDRVLGLFGAEFSTGYSSLMILAVGQLLNTMTGSTGAATMMTGHQNIAAATMVGCAIVNILLNYGLILLYGIEGAAFATLLSSSIWNLILAVYLLKKLRLNVFVIPVFRSTKNN